LWKEERTKIVFAAVEARKEKDNNAESLKSDVSVEKGTMRSWIGKALPSAA